MNVINITIENRNHFNALIDGYNELSWYQRIFFPWALGIELKKAKENGLSDDNAWLISSAFVKNTWFFHRWFFPGLSVFYNTNLAFILRDKQTSCLFTGNGAQANFEGVVRCEIPNDYASALAMLYNAGLLTGDLAKYNRDAFAGRKCWFTFIAALEKLQAAGLLTQANFEALAKHPNPEPAELALSIITLDDMGLLAVKAGQANFEALAGLKSPYRVVCFLKKFRSQGWLAGNVDQSYFDTGVTIYSAAFFGNTTKDPLGNIPGTLLTAEQLKDLVDIAIKYKENPKAGEVLVEDYVNREIFGCEIHSSAGGTEPLSTYGQGFFDGNKPASAHNEDLTCNNAFKNASP